jgi:hypothetical protein
MHNGNTNLFVPLVDSIESTFDCPYVLEITISHFVKEFRASLHLVTQAVDERTRDFLTKDLIILNVDTSTSSYNPILS